MRLLFLAALLALTGCRQGNRDFVVFTGSAFRDDATWIVAEEKALQAKNGARLEIEKAFASSTNEYGRKVADTQAAVRASIKDAVMAALSSVREGPPLLCFEPRHAVCLKKGEMHIDMLICFECQLARIRYLEIRGKEVISKEEIVSIGVGGRDTLNRILDAQKIERDIPNTEPNQPSQPMPLTRHG